MSPNALGRTFACRFCGHDIDKHNPMQGCTVCTCAGTRGEGTPRTDAELDARVLGPTEVRQGKHYRLRAEMPKPKPVVPRHVLEDMVEQISTYVGEHTDEPDYTPEWAKHIGQILDQMKPWEDR